MSDHRKASISQRLQAPPALLVVVAGLVALTIAITACGGGGDSEDASATPIPTGSATSTPTATPSGPLPEVTDVAPELDFFGELAAVHSHPVTKTFDLAADFLSLADGSSVEVPAGAFPAATEVSVVIIDLLFENYLVNPPEARIYVLSTEDDVVLGAPIVLEMPKPADSVRVTRLVDGEWLPVDVPAGTTTLIEITHFSQEPIWVGDKTPGNPEPKPGVGETSGVVVADLLAGCIVYMGDFFEEDRSALVFEIFLGVCTKALVNLLTPSGEKVEVECVGDEIGDGVNIQEAINECLAKQKASPSPSANAAPQPEPDADPDPAPASKITGTLAPGIASSSPAVAQCIERPDFDAIFCDYTFNVTMDYVVSGLPAQVQCAFPDQSPDFFSLAAGLAELSSLDGIVSPAPMAVAVFDPSGSPQFSNPVSVECVLSTPVEGEEGVFRRLDDHTFTLDLPNVDQIDGCIPATSPDCSVQ